MRKLLAFLLVFQLLCGQALASWEGNGSNRDVSVADNAIHSIADGSSLSFSLWVYVISNAGSASNVMLAWNSLSAANSFGVYCREASNGTAPNTVQFSVEDNDNDPIAFNSGASVPCGTTNTWFHVVFVVANNTTTGYVNGTQVGTSNSGNFDDVDAAVAMTVLSANAASYFNGRVAELARYSRALTTGEITALTKYAPNCLPGKVWYLPAIRDYNEIAAGLAVTNNSSTVAEHPPLIRCY